MPETGSWGRIFDDTAERQPPLLESIGSAVQHGQTVLPYGMGRSYGDSCLNSSGKIIDCSSLGYLKSFSSKKGILNCEAGVTLAEIIRVFLPRGWFPAVTPGTRFVTVGGAIANDVHGKNHHCAGSFGCFVESLLLLRSDGRIVHCSLNENRELFEATIGGLGLTGLILSAEIKLKKVGSHLIDAEFIQFRGLDQFFRLSEQSRSEWEYTVSWLDCLSSGKNFARGIFIRGNHPEQGKMVTEIAGAGRLFVPFDFPDWALNRYSMRAFNSLYFHKQLKPVLRKTVDYNSFFYPLDGIRDWNRIYGKRGFYQFQCVVPRDDIGRAALSEILGTTVKAGAASFLAVLKEFGDIESPGLMSFPRSGVTLCMDFANRGDSTRELLLRLEKLSIEAGGALYPAKDALMSAHAFRASYPKLEVFKEYIDPGFCSDFWKRVLEGEN